MGCKVEGCDAKHHAQGWCSTHWSRVKKSGDPSVVGDHYPGRPRLDVVTYAGAHKRVMYDRGRAADYRCVECSSPAHEWSYNGEGANECTGLVRGHFLAWSPDPEDYSPRCRPCHRRMDDSLIRDRDSGGKFATAHRTSTHRSATS